MITPAHLVVLRHIGERQSVDIRRISEPYRQKAIDLGMMEPPLIDIDADQMEITDVGRNLLSRLAP